MIISAKKPLEEIRACVAPFEKLAIVGCGGCAAVCQTGGTKQVEELAGELKDKEIVFTFQIDEPCDRRILARELRRVGERLEKADAVLMLGCGTGVQALASEIDKPCLAGLDTVFAGTVFHSNSYAEFCGSCGECVLNLTAALCPKTLCPKGIINGPCSEKLDDKCSVDPDSECVWVRIAGRLDALGAKADWPEFAPADWARRVAPRAISKVKNEK